MVSLNLIPRLVLHLVMGAFLVVVVTPASWVSTTAPHFWLRSPIGERPPTAAAARSRGRRLVKNQRRGLARTSLECSRPQTHYL